jgi:hypothetical protein
MAALRHPPVSAGLEPLPVGVGHPPLVIACRMVPARRAVPHLRAPKRKGHPGAAVSSFFSPSILFFNRSCEHPPSSLGRPYTPAHRSSHEPTRFGRSAAANSSSWCRTDGTSLPATRASPPPRTLPSSRLLRTPPPSRHLVEPRSTSSCLACSH